MLYASMALPSYDLPPRPVPLELFWPAPGNPVALWRFDSAGEWQRFIEDLSLDPRIPDIVRLKFERAQKLYVLGWLDVDLIKAGELVALTALELALKDRFGAVVESIRAKRPDPASAAGMMAGPPRHSFKRLLAHLVEKDGLTDAQIPMVVRCGGTAIGQLIGTTRPTLDERRNAMAHGDPFDGLPTSGLLELVRDLIMFAYRAYLTEAGPGAGRPTPICPSGAA